MWCSDCAAKHSSNSRSLQKAGAVTTSVTIEKHTHLHPQLLGAQLACQYRGCIIILANDCSICRLVLRLNDSIATRLRPAPERPEMYCKATNWPRSARPHRLSVSWREQRHCDLCQPQQSNTCTRCNCVTGAPASCGQSNSTWHAVPHSGRSHHQGAAPAVPCLPSLLPSASQPASQHNQRLPSIVANHVYSTSSHHQSSLQVQQPSAQSSVLQAAAAVCS